MPTLNNIRKHINSDLKAACTHSVHSHKITITSPSITVVTLTNIQIQMTHPFLHSGPQISCSQRGNSLQLHTHTVVQICGVSGLYSCSMLSEDFLHFTPHHQGLFLPFLSRLSPLCFSLTRSLTSRKLHRMQSVSGAGMIGQWEASCHRTLRAHTHRARMHSEAEREQWKSKVPRSSGCPVST